MLDTSKCLAGSGRPVAYVATFRQCQGSVRISFTAFPDRMIEVAADVDFGGDAREFLNAELSRRIEERELVPAPSSRARRTGNPDVFEQTIVPEQSIAMKALLWDEMRVRGISNSELARRLKVDEKEIRRLLNTESTHGRRLGEAIEAVIGLPVAITIVDGSRPARITRAPNEDQSIPVMNLVPAIAVPGPAHVQEFE